MLVFLQTAFEWGDVLAYGPTTVLLFLVLVTIVKLAPTWKEVKLKELEIRAGEGVVREKEAAALGQLANVLEAIAIEQRRATETIEILQRVNADANDRLNAGVNILNERLDRIERLGFQELKEITQSISSRIEKLEQEYVESQTTGAGTH